MFKLITSKLKDISQINKWIIYIAITLIILSIIDWDNSFEYNISNTFFITLAILIECLKTIAHISIFIAVPFALFSFGYYCIKKA